jgi:hypothetical protein
MRASENGSNSLLDTSPPRDILTRTQMELANWRFLRRQIAARNSSAFSFNSADF